MPRAGDRSEVLEDVQLTISDVHSLGTKNFQRKVGW